MVSLLDVAPCPDTVTIRGQAVSVMGVSAAGIAYLMKKFPEIRDLLGGRDIQFTPEGLMDKAPDAIASIIAAGTGFPGDPKAEEVAAGLAVEEQLSLLASILRLTMPSGVGPFVERVGALMAQMSVPDDDSGDGGKAPDSNSPKPSKS